MGRRFSRRATRVRPRLGGFSPGQISGLLLWLRGDLGVTITGAGVSTWADQSGTGDANKNALQGTDAQRPTVNATDAAYNNQTTLSFAAAASQQLLSGTWAATIAQPCTLFIVGNQDTVNGATFFDGITVGGRAQFYSGDVSGNLHFYAGSDLVTATVMTTKSVGWVLVNGASSSLGVNAKTAQTAGAVGAQVFTGTAIGCQFNGAGGNMTGKIAEIIVYSGDIGATARGQVLDYIASRYTIAVAA